MAVKRDARSAPPVDAPHIRFPQTLDEAVDKKIESGANASYIAGGTVIQMQRGQGYPAPPLLISLETIQDLKGITLRSGCIEIGPLTTLEACRRSPLLQQHAPCLTEALLSTAAPAVRNRGTIGGNIMYRKGDILPALLVLGASVFFMDEDGLQSLPLLSFLNRDEYGAELLSSISIPLFMDDGRAFSFYKKIGRREAFSLSVINAAGYLVLDEKGIVENVRLAAGGGKVMAQRLWEAEHALHGETFSMDILRNAYSALTADFHPEGDPYCSGPYKRNVTAHLILSHLYDNLEQNRVERGMEDA